jgi:hypothetical protein
MMFGSFVCCGRRIKTNNKSNNSKSRARKWKGGTAPRVKLMTEAAIEKTVGKQERKEGRGRRVIERGI